MPSRRSKSHGFTKGSWKAYDDANTDADGHAGAVVMMTMMKVMVVTTF